MYQVTLELQKSPPILQTVNVDDEDLREFLSTKAKILKVEYCNKYAEQLEKSKQLTAKIRYIFCKAKEDEIDDGKRKPYKSSYQKEQMSVDEALNINQFGFENDTQSDTLNHGGVDKAVCVYPWEYYDYFKEG